jgi:hypothetical protein
MKIGTGVEFNIKVLAGQFERLQFWYYWWEGCMKYDGEMDSGGMIYISSSMMINSDI